jgi:RNA polymerase sporulation-specific sigma factor
LSTNNGDLYFFEKEYTNMDDIALVTNARQGDSIALNCIFEKYNDLLKMKTHNFFINGAEKEDIVQEARIGLYKAIKSFDLEKQSSSFKTFANLCIERQLITAIKSSNRQKHIPLNSSFSLNTSAYDESDDTSVIDILDTHAVEDPLDIITKKEYYKTVENRIDENLSDFEKKVLDKYVQGESYVDIASKLDTPVKSIDNAIQRIRKKATKCINEIEEAKKEKK